MTKAYLANGVARDAVINWYRGFRIGNNPGLEVKDHRIDTPAKFWHPRAGANTQYQHWKTSYDATNAPAAPDDDLRDVESQSLSIGPDGRLVIPQEMRQAMLLDKDSRVTARVEAGELRVISRRVAIRRTQRKLRPLKRPGTDEVDAFLEDRKAMWGEE